MPTYEYKCEACDHREEVFAKMSDPPPAQCEACGATELVKVLFPVAVHYKGSGFYSTDYGSKPGAGAATTGSDGAAVGSSDGGSSSNDSASSTSASTGSSDASSGSAGGFTSTTTSSGSASPASPSSD